MSDRINRIFRIVVFGMYRTNLLSILLILSNLSLRLCGELLLSGDAVRKHSHGDHEVVGSVPPIDDAVILHG